MGQATEEAFDPPAAARPAGPRMHELDLQRGTGLGHVLRSEVRAVVDVKSLGDAAHRPARILLAPDRVARAASAVWVAHGAATERA